jgi:hypothetical protein
MQVTWERMWPRWVGTTCAVFGLANVIGALAAPSEIIIRGIVIGSIWVAVGLWGLPLFASASQDITSPERIAKGLQTIRRRRLLAYAALLAWLLIAAIILPRVSEKLLPTVFLLITVPVAAHFVSWMLSACPRCQRYFFPILRPRFFVSLSRCDKCGLEIHDA